MFAVVWRLSKLNLILLITIVLFASTSISYWLFDYSWLEQQRIMQLVLVAVASCLFINMCWRASVTLPPRSLLLYLAISFGLLSASLSEYPVWAFKEWSKYAALVALILYCGIAFKELKLQQAIVFILFAVVVLSTVQFFSFYLASFFSGPKSVSPYLMYAGFDNPRFYGQFQVIFLPMLHALLMQHEYIKKYFNKNIVAIVLVLQWCIVWALAGRGVLLGLFLSISVLLFFTRFRFKKIFLHYFIFSIVGGILYLVLFYVIPDWAGLSQILPSSFRADLSAREVLWLGAVEMIRTSPVFGVGPLHYSTVWNHIGAHPHQAVLQFAAEWGLFATAMFIYVISMSLFKGLSVLNNTASAIDVGIWLSILGSLILAQVDGVFVMPYTEGWLALIAGLALARWGTPRFDGSTKNKVVVCLSVALTVIALFFVIRVLVVDVPILHETSKVFYEKNKIGSPPRFWDQGWIPM